MDETVLAAIARWPNVPAVFGWLSLTARGQWRIRGEPIANAAIREFIGRNYGGDDRGRWYFQNGPQRVYVTLELAPWVYRLQADVGLRSFTGVAPTRLLAAALVDGGTLVLQTELGAGNIDDRDVERFLPVLVDAGGRRLDETAIERALAGERPMFVDAARCGMEPALVPVRPVARTALEATFGFVAMP
jgi:hypothetical protein